MVMWFRLNELEADREGTLARKEECRARLAAAAATREARAARRGALDAAYRRAQAARGFLTDLIECLDEKVRRRPPPRVALFAAVGVF